MRLVGLVLLAGCSALIPPRLWHPSGWEADEGRLGCASYAYPAVDLAFGAPMLGLGVAGAVVGTEPANNLVDGVVKGLAMEAAVIGLAAGALWTGSAIYGFSSGARCHRELERANAAKTDVPKSSWQGQARF